MHKDVILYSKEDKWIAVDRTLTMNIENKEFDRLVEGFEWIIFVYYDPDIREILHLHTTSRRLGSGRQDALCEYEGQIRRKYTDTERKCALCGEKIPEAVEAAAFLLGGDVIFQRARESRFVGAKTE